MRLESVASLTPFASRSAIFPCLFPTGNPDLDLEGAESFLQEEA